MSLLLLLKLIISRVTSVLTVRIPAALLPLAPFVATHGPRPPLLQLERYAHVMAASSCVQLPTYGGITSLIDFKHHILSLRLQLHR